MIELMLGDIILMKLDAFQGKKKAKDRWSEVDMPTYEVKDDGGNIKVIHHNRLFLVALARETATPLGGGKSISYVGAARSALAELTPLECEGETSESEVESAHTQHLPSHVPLGWVDGVLQPLML